MKRLWLKVMLAFSIMLIMVLIYHNHQKVNTITHIKDQLRTVMQTYGEKSYEKLRFPATNDEEEIEQLTAEVERAEPSITTTTTTKLLTTTTTTTTTEEPTTTTETTSEQTKSPSTCVPKKNMVYLKTHKTASSAVQNIIMRRAIKEKLRILEPRNQHDFAYPRKFIWPKPKAPPNLICHHARFNYDQMNKMPNDSVWVASVREPLSLYKSTIAYFRPIVPAFRRTQPNDSIELWFDQAENFVKTSKRSAYDHFTRNHMFFDFGYDRTRGQDMEYVEYAIEQLDKIFDLVLVADHFDESMVLLSDLLCWPIEDFACLTLNARKEDSKKISEEAEERTRRKVRDWNKADAMIFDHFNASLWRKIEEYGLDRMEEQLEILHNETERLSNSCLAKTDPVELSKLNSKQRSAFYQPSGVKLTAYQLRDNVEPVCRHLVQAENSFSKEVFQIQKSNWTIT